MTIGSGFRSPLLVTYESVDPCLGLHLNQHTKRRKSRRTCIAALGAVFITTVTTMQTNLRSLLSSNLLMLQLILRHLINEPQVRTGLTTMV